ncbi:MAG TPA: PQQ-binding-like beta-propeller repeat protein [Bryobacteraceae bacterium]|nr:PQQ-binding-like beta-propeller repeat protein [Bryobacteraceae bacterium]
MRLTARASLFGRSACLSALLLLSFSAIASAADWLTYAHDPQRSGWSFEETTLTPANVSQLGLKWKTKLENKSYSLSAVTAPVVATKVSTAHGVRSVVYVAGIQGNVFAVDAETGEELWEHTFRYVVSPGKGGYQGTFLCPNGITATPVIDKETNTLYVLGGDGALYGLDLGSGEVRYGPVNFVAPFAKSWSLNILNGVVYTVLSQGCGNGLSGFYAINVQDPHHPVIRQMLLSNTNTAGIWGAGGAILGDNGRIYGSTADGHFSPAAGDYSNSVVSASLPDLNLADYYLPPNWRYLQKRDLDMGSASPVYFGWQKRKLVATGTKESIVRLLDAGALGGGDHQTPLYTSPQLGNDNGICCEGLGIWGALSTARDDEGQTWLFVPMGGPPSTHAPRFPMTNGDNPHGSIMAFKVVANPETHDPVLEPAWISGDFNIPDPVIIANGIVFALSTGENAVQHGSEKTRLLNTRPAVLKALDLKTGKELYNSGTAMASWVHFSGLALSDGQVFAVDHDSNVYCFGLPPKK